LRNLRRGEGGLPLFSWPERRGKSLETWGGGRRVSLSLAGLREEGRGKSWETWGGGEEGLPLFSWPERRGKREALRNLRRRADLREEGKVEKPEEEGWRVSLSLAISGTGHKMLAPPPPIFTASIQSEEMGWREGGGGGGGSGRGENCHGKQDVCLITWSGTIYTSFWFVRSQVIWHTLCILSP
jgi:hypothetical protein